MIESVDPDDHHQLLGLGRERATSWSTRRTGVIGQPTFSFIMLNTAVAPTNDLSIRQALAKGMNQAQLQRILGGPPAKPVNGIFLPDSPYYSKTALSRPTTPPGRRAWSAATRPKHGTPVLAIATIPDPIADQGGAGRPADVAAGRIRRHHHRGAAGHHHRRLRAGQVPGGHLLPVRGGQSRPQLRVVEHHHRVTARQDRPQLHPPRGPADRDRACSRDATPPTSPPGCRPTRRSTSDWPRTCPTCGSSSTSSRRWLRTGSRTSTTRPCPAAAGLRLRRRHLRADPDLVERISGRATGSSSQSTMAKYFVRRFLQLVVVAFIISVLVLPAGPPAPRRSVGGHPRAQRHTPTTGPCSSSSWA